MRGLPGTLEWTLMGYVASFTRLLMLGAHGYVHFSWQAWWSCLGWFWLWPWSSVASSRLTCYDHSSLISSSLESMMEQLMLLSQGLHDQGIKLKSSTPGQNLMCDISGPTLGDYKALPGMSYGGKLPTPPQIWCIASALQFSRGSYS